jgi:geranylgeranyl diphosphate synthase, type I
LVIEMLAYFKNAKELVAQELKRYFAAKRAALEAVNPLGPDAGDRLLEFALQGKMIRGGLVPLGYALGTAAGPGAVQPPSVTIAVGAAMELFQSGLLVHDDIMDRDLTRRGSATIFHQYAEDASRREDADPRHVGEALGICAGDVAYFLAFEMLAGVDAPAAARAELLGMCARELTSVGIAQMQDVAWGASAADVRDEDILRMYTFKTSRYSFSLPLAAGALIAGAPPAVVGKLEEIGETIGVLFQVRDDELGLFGDERELGKPVGSDVREGKKTLYYARLMLAAPALDRDRLGRIFGNQAASRDDLDFVRARAVSLGVQEGVASTCAAMRERAVQGIASLRTGSAEDRDTLRSLLDFALERRQ